MEIFSTEWWNTVNGKPGRPRDERRLDAQYGPRYPKLDCLEKYRKLAREGRPTPGYSAAVYEAFRNLNNPLGRRAEIPLRCTVVNTCGTDNTAAGEDERYRLWVDVTLPIIRIAKALHADYVAGLREKAFTVEPSVELIGCGKQPKPRVTRKMRKAA